VQEAQREARLASCLATPGMTGQERSTGELLNSAIRRLAVASDVNTQLRCSEFFAPVSAPVTSVCSLAACMCVAVVSCVEVGSSACDALQVPLGSRAIA